MKHPHQESPVNPLPPVVWALFLVIVGLEAAFSLGARGLVGGPEAVGWRNAAIERFGFNATIFDWMVQTGQWPVEHLVRFLSYPFVHVSFTHTLFVGVILLAMGKIVAEAMGAIVFVAVFFVTSAGGALAWAVVTGDRSWLVGGYPPVYGLIGAFTYLLWLRLGQTGAPQARAFTLIGFLMGFQLLMGMFYGSATDWIADLAGFACGFVLSVVLVPGGWARLRARLRQRD